MSRYSQPYPAGAFPYYGRRRPTHPLLRMMNHPVTRAYAVVFGLIGVTAAIAIVVAFARDMGLLYQER